MGIGRILTQTCIECAASAGYAQLELEAVKDNGRAVGLYKSLGFEIYGENERGFLSRYTGYQTLILMKKELL